MQSIPDPTGSVSDTLLVGTNPAFLIRNNFFYPNLCLRVTTDLFLDPDPTLRVITLF
jgi:hypothetical protein